MMTPKTLPAWVVGLLGMGIALALAAGCAVPLAPESEIESAPHTVRQKIEQLSHALAPADLAPGVNREDRLVFTEYVALWSVAPPVAASPVEQGETDIFVLARTGELTGYPCSECHVRPLADLRAESAATGQLAHWEITLNHAPPETMDCTTCHQPEAGAGEDGAAGATSILDISRVDQLLTLQGHNVPFDASYQVCAQCHTDQFNDWLGGAHGKQVGGWAPPRVMATCSTCHNPHAPQWDQRWPAYPVSPRKGE